MNFIVSILLVWGIVTALNIPCDYEINRFGKVVKHGLTALVIALTIMMSYQLGRVQGHYDAVDYIYEEKDLPKSSVFKYIWHKYDPTLPI